MGEIAPLTNGDGGTVFIDGIGDITRGDDVGLST